MKKQQAAIYAYSDRGRKLAERIAFFLQKEQVEVIEKELTTEVFRAASAIVFVGACGIAVRKIAPFLQDKKTDPAVLVVDEAGQHCIALLSGHFGGANALCERLSAYVGATPVITTATDLAGVFAVDVFAKTNDLLLTDWTLAREIAGALLRSEPVGIESESGLDRWVSVHDYAGLTICDKDMEEERPNLGIWIGNGFRHGSEKQPFLNTLYLRPKNLVLGIGCRKGKSAEELFLFVEKALSQEHLALKQVCKICSVDQKRQEPGLVALAERLEVPFVTFGAESLQEAYLEESEEGGRQAFEESDFVRTQIGVGNVCERSAILGSGQHRLLLPKRAENGMTLAVAEFK